jgi:hypothetical protein
MMVHELAVLPLPAGAAGTGPVGADGRVSEEGSLGEASSSCGEGPGKGIAPGRNAASSAGDRWVGTGGGSWMLWTAVGIAGIWVAVLLISLFAPDMVSGSEQQHLPIASFTTWFWGGVGTVVFLWAMGKVRGPARWRPMWIWLSVTTLAMWTIATILGIEAPVFVTGSDPTQIPVVAFVAPVVAVMLTAFAGVIANVFLRRAPSDSVR